MQNLEHKVYALISTDASLQDILDTLILGIEERDPKVLGSVLSLEDGNTLRHLSSPRLSKAYREAIDSLKIGPAVGSCGTACYRRERVVVSDIVTDPLWAKFADFAASEGLRACWSQPIISSKNQVLGAFAMYYRHPHSPTDEDIRLIEHAARVASIAIERKQADVALHKSEERYRKLFEYAPDGILIIGPDKNYIDANISLCRMLGYSRNELMKLHAEDIVAKAEIQRVEPAFRDIKARLNHSQEWQLRRKDGSVFMADVIATQLPDRNILSMIHDITERKEAEATLEKSETRLRLSIAASNIGLWDWNLVTNDVYFSPEWKGQLGYTADEMPNRFEEWERRLHPDDLAPTLAKVRAFIENPAGGYTVEFRLRHKDGSYRWIFTQAQILSDAAGKPVRMMGCHIDITDRKNLEESLAHKNIALGRKPSQTNGMDQ